MTDNEVVISKLGYGAFKTYRLEVYRDGKRYRMMKLDKAEVNAILEALTLSTSTPWNRKYIHCPTDGSPPQISAPPKREPKPKASKTPTPQNKTLPPQRGISIPKDSL